MPQPRRRRHGPQPDRRRALELLAASHDGATEAIMLAHGFTVELLVELIRAGLATATAAIFWRRSSSPWLPQPPKVIVLSVRDFRRLEATSLPLFGDEK